VVRRDELQLLHEIGVGLSDRAVRALDRPVGHAEDRGVAAGDVDVLDVGDVEQCLDVAEPPQRVLHRTDDSALRRRIELWLRFADPPPCLSVELGLDPRQCELAEIGRIEAVPARILRQPSRHRRVDAASEVG
jgi:hypothetical protein